MTAIDISEELATLPLVIRADQLTDRDVGRKASVTYWPLPQGTHPDAQAVIQEGTIVAGTPSWVPLGYEGATVPYSLWREPPDGGPNAMLLLPDDIVRLAHA
jgi:hypothetical protein